MRLLCVFWTVLLLSACGKYNAVDIMTEDNPDVRDIGLCGGGAGIDNQLGLVIRSEASKSGGELSASQRSRIQAAAVDAGVLSANNSNYETYVRCILELNKRRGDKHTLNLQQRLQQPALKVWRQGYEGETAATVVRRLLIENTGEELTELKVTEAPFLVISAPCGVEKSGKCRDSSVGYIPLENFYSSVRVVGAYQGELYSVEEVPGGLDGVVNQFKHANAVSAGGEFSDSLALLVKVRYKDKFQNLHERYFDVTVKQLELELLLGRELFAYREALLEAGHMINVRKATVQRLTEVWMSVQRPRSELPGFWRSYEHFFWREV